MPETSRSRRAAAPWIWGVDTDVEEVWCTAIKHDQKFGFALPPSRFERPKGPAGPNLPETLKRKREELLSSIRAWSVSAPPVAVFVEVPMGRHTSPSLSAAYGVTLEALAHMLLVPVYPVNIADWKKAYPGFANASKEQVARAAAQDGFTHAVQDAIDAYAIARAGSTMTTLSAAA